MKQKRVYSVILILVMIISSIQISFTESNNEDFTQIGFVKEKITIKDSVYEKNYTIYRIYGFDGVIYSVVKEASNDFINDTFLGKYVDFSFKYFDEYDLDYLKNENPNDDEIGVSAVEQISESENSPVTLIDIKKTNLEYKEFKNFNITENVNYFSVFKSSIWKSVKDKQSLNLTIFENIVDKDKNHFNRTEDYIGKIVNVGGFYSNGKFFVKEIEYSSFDDNYEKELKTYEVLILNKYEDSEDKENKESDKLGKFVTYYAKDYYKDEKEAISQGKEVNSYYMVFEEKELLNKYPTSNLSDLKLLIKGYQPLKEDGYSKVFVSDWELLSENKDTSSISGKVINVKYKNDNSIVFNFMSDKGNVTQLSFEKQLLQKNMPDISLSGTRINALVQYLNSNKTSATVLSWTSLGEKEDSSEEEKEEGIFYSGKMIELLYKEKHETKNFFIESIFKFKDFNDKEYVLSFKEDISNKIPLEDWEGKNVLIKGLKKGFDGNNQIIEVESIQEKTDDYYNPDNEFVVANIELSQFVTREKGYSVYRSKYENKVYDVLFSESILKEDFVNKFPIDTKLKIVALKKHEGDKLYLSVLEYKYEDKLNEYGEGKFNGLNYQSVKGTPIRILSQTEDEVLYFVSTENNDGHLVLFSKDMLMSKMPNEILIGQNLDLILGYVDTAENSYIALDWDKSDKENYSMDRGIFLKVVNDKSDMVELLFKSVNNKEYKILISASLYDNLKAQDLELGETTFSIFGKERIINNERLFVISALNKIDKEYLNEQTGHNNFTFTGIVKELVESTETYNLYYIENKYGQYAIGSFETDILKEKYPISDLTGKEIVIDGFLYTNGVVKVKGYNLKSIPDFYPNPYKSLYKETIYFPHMKTYTGLISTIKTDSPHITLVTASDKYFLYGTDEIMKKVEDNLGKIVCMRGTYKERGKEHWEGTLKVYDFVPCDSYSYNVIISPIGNPIPEPPTGDKDAHYTIQLTIDPTKYKYGDGIIEALFIPELIIDKTYEK